VLCDFKSLRSCSLIIDVIGAVLQYICKNLHQTIVRFVS
jgi:hypothetical protein